MKELIFKIKKSKVLLAVLICCAIIFAIDLAMFIFDITELILISGNSAMLSSAFLGFNVVVAILNFIMLVAGSALLIVRRKKFQISK